MTKCLIYMIRSICLVICITVISCSNSRSGSGNNDNIQVSEIPSFDSGLKISIDSLLMNKSTVSASGQALTGDYDYQLASIDISVINNETQAVVDSFHWIPSDGSHTYQSDPATGVVYKIRVSETALCYGNTVVITKESEPFELKPMVITFISITPESSLPLSGETENPPFMENFETVAIDAIPSHWISEGIDCYVGTSNDPAGSSNKCLKIVDASTVSAPGFSRVIGDQNYGQIRFKMYISSTAAYPQSDLFIYSSTGSYVIKLLFNKDNKIKITQPDGTLAEIGGYSFDVWNGVVVKWNRVSGLYKIFVNGMECGVFSMMNGETPYKIKFRAGNSSNVSINDSAAYVDDIFVTIDEKASVDPSLRQVSLGSEGSGFGYYGVCPESPDGSRIVYTKFKVAPIDDKYDYPAELYVCNRDFTNHMKVADLAQTGYHNTCRPLWLDNDRIAYADDNKYTYILNVTTGVTEFGSLGAGMFQHNAFENKILITVTTNSSTIGPKGLYSFDYRTGEIKTILLNSQLMEFSQTDLGMPEFTTNDTTEKGKPYWWLHHAQWSPDGKTIACNIIDNDDTEAEYIISFKADGSDIVPFGRQLSHWQWYDNETIFGHETRPSQTYSKYIKRADRYGAIIDVLAGIGVHCAMSPDKKWFSTEFSAESGTRLKLGLFKSGTFTPAIELFNTPYFNVAKTDYMRAHVNPSFSRDGLRVYFIYPVSDSVAQSFCYDISEFMYCQ
jgi:hypothetical protein